MAVGRFGDGAMMGWWDDDGVIWEYKPKAMGEPSFTHTCFPLIPIFPFPLPTSSSSSSSNDKQLPSFDSSLFNRWMFMILDLLL